jgi:2-oxoglutarate ferredoxin oxidoreductase subunit beta
MAAITLMEQAKTNQLFVTGLIYINSDRPDLRDYEDLPETPLAHLLSSAIRPSKASLEKLMRDMA